LPRLVWGALFVIAVWLLVVGLLAWWVLSTVVSGLVV